MIDSTIINVVVGSIITGTITGLASFAAIRVELKYLRRDTDNNTREIKRHQEQIAQLSR